MVWFSFFSWLYWALLLEFGLLYGAGHMAYAILSYPAILDSRPQKPESWKMPSNQFSGKEIYQSKTSVQTSMESYQMSDYIDKGCKVGNKHLVKCALCQMLC